MKNVIDMSTKEIVQEYNSLTGKSTTKFSSRAAGEKQLVNARKGFSVAQLFAKPESVEKKINRARAIRASWLDPSVAAKRAQRSGVIVDSADGKLQYKSVLAAFKELGLPVAKHIKFRMELKEEGAVVFEHQGKHIKFRLENKK